MSQSTGDMLFPDSVLAQLAALYQQLSTISHDLIVEKPSSPTPHLSQREAETLFSYLVSDILRGNQRAIDYYPALYRQLKMDGEFRQNSLHLLKLLQASVAGELTSLPTTPSRDLNFLKRVDPTPIIAKFADGRSQITLKCPIIYLNGLLTKATPPPEMVLRNSLSPLEIPPLTLLRSQMTVAKTALNASLIARQILADNQAPALSMTLTVAATAGMINDRLPLFQATIQWGRYHEAKAVSPKGHAAFPPLFLNTVLDEMGEQFQHDLQLILLQTADN